MKFEECWADLGKALALGDVARAWRIWRVLGKVHLDERDQDRAELKATNDSLACTRAQRDDAWAEAKKVREERDQARAERDELRDHVKALQDMTKDRDTWRDGFTALARWLTLLVTPKVVIAQVISSTTENPS